MSKKSSIYVTPPNKHNIDLPHVFCSLFPKSMMYLFNVRVLLKTKLAIEQICPGVFQQTEVLQKLISNTFLTNGYLAVITPLHCHPLLSCCFAVVRRW